MTDKFITPVDALFVVTYLSGGVLREARIWSTNSRAARATARSIIPSSAHITHVEKKVQP